MSNPSLLIELGTEELPPTSLKKLSEAFSSILVAGLLDAQLIQKTQAKNAQSYASPRRLALLVTDVASKQPDQDDERRGPAIAAAFNSAGEPTSAAIGFAKSCGVDIDQLARLKTDKGEWLSYTVHKTGRSLTGLIDGILDEAVKRLPIPKRMRWGSGDAEFVRPVHWLVVMHGARVINTNILGLSSNNITIGHRVHSKGAISLSTADEYATLLESEGCVIASYEARQQLIQQQINTLAESINAQLDDDQDLLDEVTGLVEKPQALLGNFSPKFLQVPSECLISAMRDHQKYFHLRDANGTLLPHFITVSNINSKSPQRVIAGNERVINARLSDAQFFWDTDRKQTLADFVPQLESVTFHAKLGTVAQRAQRVEILATDIADKMGAQTSVVKRAAKLAKADLVTDMVGEFDKLQGVMGRYYADLDGEPELVGASIEQHYWPRYAGDQLPIHAEAQALALADRVDTLTGIFSTGEIPTGDKDPYSLRRAALGVLRILIEHNLALELPSIIKASADAYASQSIVIPEQTQQHILDFITSRLMAYYQSQGVATNTVNAVLACGANSPANFNQRLQAVRGFNELNEAIDLAAANKRISNILKKQSETPNQSINIGLLSENAEQTLHTALKTISKQANAHFDKGDYAAGLKVLRELKSPVDAFFESVMVMSDNADERANRLALLVQIRALFMRVADIALLQT